MGEHDEQLDRIRQKLGRVREQGIATFGSGAHGYELGPPLAEAEVRAFEVEHGVTLPEGYRAFVTRVGHGGTGDYGGAGPYYGLYEIDDWDDFIAWIADDVPADWLSRPSPLRPGSNELPDIDPDDVPDDEWPPDDLVGMYHGILTLGSRGCTYSMGVVVTGEARGRVVYLDAGHIEPPYVSRDSDFLDWYERWLDELLAGVESSWFGYGPAGDEAVLLELIRTSEDDELVREAISNLSKLPRRTDAVWDVVAAKVDSAAVGVRKASIWLLGRSSMPQLAEVVAGRLHDEEDGVRGTVYEALLELDPQRWHDVVWEAVQGDREAGERAYGALRRAELLDDERLLAVIDDASLGEFRWRAVPDVDWQPEQAEMLFELLDAPNAVARRAAADELARLQLAPEDERLVERLGVEDDHYARRAMIRLVVATEERRAAPRLLEFAAEGDDFLRIEAVGALAKLGDDRVAPIACEMLASDRTPVAPGRGHTRKICDLVREKLAHSPSPKLRALAEIS